MAARSPCGVGGARGRERRQLVVRGSVAPSRRRGFWRRWQSRASGHRRREAIPAMFVSDWRVAAFTSVLVSHVSLVRCARAHTTHRLAWCGVRAQATGEAAARIWRPSCVATSVLSATLLTRASSARWRHSRFRLHRRRGRLFSCRQGGVGRGADGSFLRRWQGGARQRSSVGLTGPIPRQQRTRSFLHAHGISIGSAVGAHVVRSRRPRQDSRLRIVGRGVPPIRRAEAVVNRT